MKIIRVIYLQTSSNTAMTNISSAITSLAKQVYEPLFPQGVKREETSSIHGNVKRQYTLVIKEHSFIFMEEAMMEHISVEKMWKEYLDSLEEEKDGPSEYDAYSFCNDEESANRLAALVKEGKKRATSSLYLLYELEGEELPAINSYSIILNWTGDAQCVIRNTKVSLIPFNEVTNEFAKSEGEGDLSLEYWQEAHRAFFIEALKEIDKEFTEDMLVVCEEFEVVYPRQN